MVQNRIFSDEGSLTSQSIDLKTRENRVRKIALSLYPPEGRGTHMVSLGLSKGARNLAVFLLVLTFLALVLGWFNHESLIPLFVIARDNLWGRLEGTSPWLFFSAYIILPCMGSPISPFYLIAPGIYGLQFCLMAFGLAILASISLGFWVATGVLRPVVEKLISRTRFTIPAVRPCEHMKLAVILRITPGIPFFIQNCLLGLSGIPFRVYFIVSWPIQMAWALGFLFLGKSAFEGRLGLAVFGGGLIIALVLVTKIARDRYAAGSRSE